MVFELTEDYHPEFFPHRGEQEDKINHTFNLFNRRGHSENLLILGTTGSGKTSLIRKIFFNRASECYYVNACSENSTRKIFMNLSSLPPQKSTSDMVNRFIQSIKKNKKILIIDEVDKTRDLINLINFLNLVYRETQIPIILITNKRTFIEEMPDDARLTLFLQRVDFPTYNALQLKDILRYRLDLFYQRESTSERLDDGVIDYICALSLQKYDGSARTVLDISKKCLLNDKLKFNEAKSFIDKTSECMDEEEWVKFVRKLSMTEKDFLEIIIHSLKDKSSVTPADVHQNMSQFTPSRISQLISTFCDYGIIKTEYRNLGRRGGSYRMIKFSSPITHSKMIELICPQEED